jgi:uncharacterized protein (DUF427 family)
MEAQRIKIEPSPKRIRAMVGGETVADSIATLLLIEGYLPVHYFPREDVRTDLLHPAGKRTHEPGRGEASWWSVEIDDLLRADAAWSFPHPDDVAELIQDHVAFDWDKVDRWFEEDEEIFGHPRDPHHRVDVRPSSRTVEVGFGGETIASTRRGMFLFETGMPPRYYIPLEDVRANLLAPSSTSTICPYKGTASYWHLRVGGRAVDDAVWAYLDPLSDCPRIKGYLCFDPEKVDRLEVDLPRIANRTIEDVLAA